MSIAERSIEVTMKRGLAPLPRCSRLADHPARAAPAVKELRIGDGRGCCGTRSPSTIWAIT